MQIGEGIHKWDYINEDYYDREVRYKYTFIRLWLCPASLLSLPNCLLFSFAKKSRNEETS